MRIRGLEQSPERKSGFRNVGKLDPGNALVVYRHRMSKPPVESSGAVAFGLLVALLLWESAAGFMAFFRGRLRERLGHDAINLCLGGINALFNATAAAALWMWTARVVSGASFGLLHWLELSRATEFVLAVLLLDLWMYWWHRLCHRIPMLWRFHRVHHSDPRMDVSTAYRFHFGEMAASAVVRVPVIAVMGLGLEHILLFEVMMFAVVQIQHANIGLPPTLDRVLRRLIVTPFMHKIHHSDLVAETDSNYCSLFSWWDRVFGTYRERADLAGIRFGLAEFQSAGEQKFAALILNPFAGSGSKNSVVKSVPKRNAPPPNENKI
jgi:sterol desaturase/sphingolipid hydroxylase (fatty acid hydroxylase superfamily)